MIVNLKLSFNYLLIEKNKIKNNMVNYIKIIYELKKNNQINLKINYSKIQKIKMKYLIKSFLKKK